MGEVTVHQVYEIAKLKQQDSHLSLIPLRSLARTVIAVSKSMGIRVVSPKEENEKLADMKEIEEMSGKGVDLVAKLSKGFQKKL